MEALERLVTSFARMWREVCEGTFALGQNIIHFYMCTNIHHLNEYHEYQGIQQVHGSVMANFSRKAGSEDDGEEGAREILKQVLAIDRVLPFVGPCAMFLSQ